MRSKNIYLATITAAAIALGIWLLLPTKKASEKSRSTQASPTIEPQRPSQLTQEAQLLLESWQKQDKWSWTATRHASTDTWDVAWSKAEQYRRNDRLDRMGFLQAYQNVLDGDPPPRVDLVTRLEIGQALVVSFQPFRDAEGLAWYTQLIEKYKDRKWRGHRCVMVAKLHLADLLHRHRDTRQMFGSRIQALYEEVLDVPEEEITFESEANSRLNIDEIAKAELPGRKMSGSPNPVLDQMMAEATKEHRMKLLAERKEELDALRLSAARSYAYKQWNPLSPQATKNRLLELRRSREMDEMYIAGFDEVIKRADEVIKAGGKHGVHELEDSTVRHLH
jgi:hypothetical protein